jgi:seryl-tRNA synthetase
MIDIQILRDNPELVAQKAREKNMPIDTGKVLELDASYRKLLLEVEQLRQDRNSISDQMKNGKPEPELIEKGKQIKIELADREDLFLKSKAQLDELLIKIPNLHFDDVPIGDEGDGEEISRFGDCEQTGAVDHLDFAIARDWVDFERGAKVAGAKFYFLKGDLALLENALTQFALEITTKHGLTPMLVPHIVNDRTAAGAGFAPRDPDASNEYVIENEKMSLIGTSEAPLTGYHADEILPESDLPILYSGYSACYRKEAGTYGKHTRGLFRVHQFNKVEMYAFTTQEQSAAMHDKLLQIEQEIWQAINIPYRVVNIPTGDLGAPAAKKYDIEYWSKVDGEFRELTSTSNGTDYQTRNLTIRLRRDDGTIEYAHSLNGTAISHARGLITILEHYQNSDGTLRVPEVLQKYMGGREVL